MDLSGLKFKHFVLALLLFSSIALTFLFYVSNKVKNYKMVKYEDFISQVYLTGSEGYGYLRGQMY